MILSTGLEVVMEKERVNYRGVFLFRKHMFIVKPKRSKNYRVKMHLILDEFYFQSYPEYNCFRLIQKNTGIIIDFFAFSTVESKIWIELMETLVEPLEDIAEKNKIFYIKAKNSYESHFSRFNLELKSLNNSNINQRNNNLRRAASSSLVNSNLEPLKPIDPNMKFNAKRDSLQICTNFDKKDSVDSLESSRMNSKTAETQEMESFASDVISFSATPKVNPIQTSTSLKGHSLNEKIEHQGSIHKNASVQSTPPAILKKSFVNSNNSVKGNSLRSKNSSGLTDVTSNGVVSTTIGTSTQDTEVSSNGSEILLFDNPIEDHELIISEPGVPVTSEVTVPPKRLVSEPESIKGNLPTKLELISDTISKTDSITSTVNLPPKYKLILPNLNVVYKYIIIHFFLFLFLLLLI